MKSIKSECAKCDVQEKICRSTSGQGSASCPTLYQKELVNQANNFPKKLLAAIE